MANKPDYIAYAKNAEGHWIKIGAAWSSQTKESKEYISLTIDCLPLQFDGKVTLHTYDRQE